MSLAAPRVRGYARAAGPGIGRTLPAAGSPRVPQDCSAGAHIVQRLAPPLPVRCGGFSVYSVRDFRMWYQAYRSLFPGDLGGSGLCGHESCPSCGRHIIKDNRFVDFVDWATIPAIQPCAGAERLAKPRPATRKDWQDERNRCSQLPDRILSHLSSSTRARISESWAASTGSRHKAERSAVLSQEEAAGSARTSSMLGRSPAPKPSHIPKLLTPLRPQLHPRLSAARRLHQERPDSPYGPGPSARVRANDNDGSRGSIRQM